MIKPFVVLVAICGFSANALEIKHFGNQEQIKADLVGKLADQDQSHFPEKSKLKHYLQLINDGCPHYLDGKIKTCLVEFPAKVYYEKLHCTDYSLRPHDSPRQI